MKAATGQMFDIDEEGNVSPVKDVSPPPSSAPAAPGRSGQPRSFTASDDELGISSPPAENDKRLPSGGEARQLGRPRAHTTTELEGDPLVQGALAGAEGALVAAPVAGLVGLAAPAAAPVVSGFAGGATATAAQGGDARDILVGGALGAIPGAATSVRNLVRSAPAAVAERLPTEITGGARSKAAKQVVGSDILADTLDAHPELKKVLGTPGDVPKKAAAVSAKLNELTEANDAATEAIAKHHGKIATDLPIARLQKLAELAEDAGDEVTRDAVAKTIESIDSFSKGSGAITAQQLRGLRNGLAAKVQVAAPGSEAFSRQAQAASAIKSELNETIADLAGDTPGVDVAALRARNRQIASLLPVKTTLEQQALAAKLNPGETLTNVIRKPMHALADAIDAAPARADLALSNPSVQRLFGRAPAAPGPAGRVAAPAAASTAARPDDLGYAAMVAQAMKGGMSLQDAVNSASR